MSIRIGIMGYGNLGRGVESAIRQNPDMTLAAVFTRRPPESVTLHDSSVPVYHESKATQMAGDIDVMILCGGSASDLPVQTPQMASLFHVVDSYDTHAKIPTHFAAVDAAAKQGGKVSVISAGWDPGMFSVNRLYGEAVLPEGSSYTFWGKGVSQGHSDAIRRIEGVADARQYTVPVDAALEAVRSASYPVLSTREKHTRECYVVIKDGADKARIEQEIKTMPNYFADYDTSVTFIDQDELDANHASMPHGGHVIRTGKTGFASEHNQVIEYALALESNPEFTSSILVACARAAYRLACDGREGCMTVLDIPPAYLSAKSGEDLRRELL